MGPKSYLSNFDELFNFVMNIMPELYKLEKDLNYTRLLIIFGVISGLVVLGFFVYSFIDKRFFQNTGLGRSFMILLLLGSLFIGIKCTIDASNIDKRINYIKSQLLSQIDLYTEEENVISILDGTYRIDMTPDEKYKAVYKYYEREVVRSIYSRYKNR